MSDLTERKLTDDNLLRSEELFRVAFIQAAVGFAITDVNGRFIKVNQSFCLLTGYSEEELLSMDLRSLTHKEDLSTNSELMLRLLTGKISSFVYEQRYVTKSGDIVWVQNGISGIPAPGGAISGFITLSQNITDRKVAEETLSRVSGRLLEAQEEERHRIARELHDDISQNLALLFVGLQALAGALPKSQVRLRDQLEPLIERTSDIASDIHSLSHRLHSSKLESLGLVAASRGFCRELSEQRDVEINFTHGEVPSELPLQISVCLFRVLQEGLSNAVKHSGVRQFEVRLDKVLTELELTIRDHGVGFDPNIAMYSEGLGLISMRERLSLMKGTMSIVSKPQWGTEIKVRIPIAARTDTDRMAASA